MKAMLVLCLAAAVYARPNPGFAYTVADPSNIALTYASAPSVFTIPQQPFVFSHVQAPLVYVAPSGCRNNEGKQVACIGEPELKEVTGAEEVAVATPDAPVAPLVPAEEVPEGAPEGAPADGTTGETKIISVEKRDAQILLNTVNTIPATNFVNPLVYAHQHIAPITYRACINNQGSTVPCSGQTLVSPIAFSTFPQVPLLPLATVEKKAEEVQIVEAKVEEAKVEEAKVEEAEAIVSVKKREADPQILINSFATPYLRPIVYTAGCRNSVGALVPCA